MKDDLNFKAVLLRLINNNKPQKQDDLNFHFEKLE